MKSIKVWISKNTHLIYIFLICVLIVIGVLYHNKLNKDLELNYKENSKLLNKEIISLIAENASLEEGNEELKKDIKKMRDNSFIIINKKTLISDMKKRFPQFSDKVSKIIVDTVMEESDKYDINPIILYALGIVESTHRYWIEHAKINILVYQNNGSGKKEKKQISTHAVGWGGVVWEYHEEMLKEKGIAEKRYDLFDPAVNIRATAAIYNKYRNLPLKKGTSHKDISAQRRYFGGNFKSYSDKIKLQIVEIMTSELYKKADSNLKTKKLENE